MSTAIQHSSKAACSRVRFAATVCAVLVCAKPVALSAAATNRPAGKGSDDRYLLIVDTSAAMERNAENTKRLVSQLLTTGMVGQARTGDTIGLWTFNDELQTGNFPLQRWTPQTRGRVAAAAVEFLSKARYEKRSRFGKVIETLTSVVQDSGKITVLILTDGSEKISGTPYDQEINESYRLNSSDQRKQRMPFITVLRAKGGEFVGWRVNTPPFRPEFPAFPVEPKVAELPEPTAGQKPESKPEPKAEPKPAAPPLVVISEAPKPVPATPTNAPPAATTQPLTTQTPATSDQPTKPKPDAQPPAPVETPAGPTTPAVTPTEAATKPSVNESPPPKSDTPQPAELKPVESTTTTSSPTVPDALPVQTAVAAPTEPLFNRANLLVAGAVLLVVAFGLVFVLMRRAARPAEKVSLITRSMDRDQK
jgi:hypothetical protein